MGRPATDWKVKLPQIIEKIEKEHLSPSVAAVECGIGAATLSEHMASNPNMRKVIEDAKIRRIGAIVEKPLIALCKNPKSPHHFNALKYVGSTQGRDYGWSENPKLAITQNIIALMPGVTVSRNGFDAISEHGEIADAEVIVPNVEIDGNGDGNQAIG